jgi:hypothetical protein
MRVLLGVGIAVALSACAIAPPPTPTPAASPTKPCPPPAPAAGSVFIRLFDGVLTLPPGYVFEGNQLGTKSLFQGPTGGVRIGPRVELSGGYLDFAQHSLKAREKRCGLDILRHGGDDPPLWLLLGKTHYALLYDRDPARVPAIIDGYCTSLQKAPSP